MKITLSNDFHNTEISLNVKNGQLSAGQVKRAQKVLCGLSDCRCSGDIGYRGRQQDGIDGIEAKHDRHGNIIGAFVHTYQRGDKW